MTWRQRLERAEQRYDGFFHTPPDLRVLALLRIGSATIVLLNLIAMLPHVELLWSERGLLPLDVARTIAGGFTPSLFALLPSTPSVLWIGYGALTLHALALLVGYRSRLQTIAVFIWLMSFQNRNLLIVNGQDALLRMLVFFLMFMPVGGAWSIDVRREWAAPTSAKTPTAWPLRLLQLQVALVMLTAALWKLEGDDWTNGTALHYVTRLDGLWGNLPLPDQFYSSLVLRAGCWATLCIEVCVPILVWFSSSRRAALMTAVLFHLALAYAMNLFLFEWIMILGWCAFLRSEDFQYVRHGWFSLRGTLNGFEREPS